MGWSVAVGWLGISLRYVLGGSMLLVTTAVVTMSLEAQERDEAVRGLDTRRVNYGLSMAQIAMPMIRPGHRFGSRERPVRSRLRFYALSGPSPLVPLVSIQSLSAPPIWSPLQSSHEHRKWNPTQMGGDSQGPFVPALLGSGASFWLTYLLSSGSESESKFLYGSFATLPGSFTGLFLHYRSRDRRPSGWRMVGAAATGVLAGYGALLLAVAPDADGFFDRPGAVALGSTVYVLTQSLVTTWIVN